MDAFTILTGISAPLPMANVDTDKIIPAQFLKTIKRSGLGVHLFAPLRYGENGEERADFVLNQEPYRNASILIAHENFGCGSSREHAPWALLDFGIRCVIAPDFADIFHNNCFKNGILPIRLPREICDLLMEDARLGKNDPLRRKMLLEGLDEIGQTLGAMAAIENFEARRQQELPWIPAIPLA
jgi:3-isopropylmalate/(R)-2-methylmalate dehydratase small subunit